jgi:hypothetical protein
VIRCKCRGESVPKQGRFGQVHPWGNPVFFC